MVFNKNWFLKYQSKLLLFANTSFGKWLLRIHKDCPKGKRIIKILPNCYTWDNQDGTVTTDFRTHDKFAKRLYYGLKPLWYVLHFWDYVTWRQPKLSFGFDTLSAYPAAGAVSPCDGIVSRDTVNETFAGIRSNAGTSANVTGITFSAGYLESSGTTNNYSQLQRSIFMFDTSSLPDTATINESIFSLYGSGKSNLLGLTDSHAGLSIVSTNPASTNNLVAADYNIANWGSTRYATDIGYTAWLTTGYNNFIFNTTGIAAVSKIGITKIGGRLAVDLDNGSPAWVSSKATYLSTHAADQTGTSNDPKLVVSYNRNPSMMIFFD